jgi:hypothetical protein
MSVSALGTTPAPAAPTYNFTNVTNSQFEQEVQQLGQDGKLTPDQQALLTLSADGGDSIPVDGTRTTTAQALSDSTLQNFIAEYQNIDYQLHHTPGSVGAPLVDSILQALQTYQGSALPNAANPAAATS